MKPARWVIPCVVSPILLTLTACASTPAPDLSSPEGGAVREAYSGTWILIPDESETFQEKMEEQMNSRESRRPGGGGMRGGAGGGRRGGGGDPEEMRRVMEETRRIAATSERIGLSLNEASTALILDDSPRLTLPLQGETTSYLDGQGEIRANAKWTSNGLEVRREIPNGGDVTDTYSLDDEGRLRLRREVRMMRGQTELILRMLYAKEGSGR